MPGTVAQRSVGGGKSQIFSPFRAIGYVSNHVRFSVQSKGKDNFVTTCIGRAYHVYNCAKLNLLFVGEQEKSDINVIETQGNLVFTACDENIKIWKRGKACGELKGHTAPVFALLSFGSHLLSVCENNILMIWDIASQELFRQIPFDASEFLISGIMHPATYLNKIILFSDKGKMQLWNIKSGRMIYEFDGWKSPITCVVQSPAVDVVGIGLLTGEIVLHNLKLDKTVMRFRHDDGVITNLAFRSDDKPVMVSTSISGNIAVWDLEERKLVSTVKGAHNDLISGAQFLNSQPLLLTSSADNSLKLWIFDQADGAPRLLKSRSGHGLGPTRVRYYGTDGHSLLSCGIDKSLRFFSTINDSQCRELSQGSLEGKSRKLKISTNELRLPVINSFAASTAREKEWDNIVTVHDNEHNVKTWSFDRKCLGKHSLVREQGKKSVSAKDVCISECGNFVIAGYSDGGLCKYNIQSGAKRGMVENAHRGGVTAVTSDYLNRFVLSTGSDKTLKVWDFKTLKHMQTIELGSKGVQLEIQNGGSLLAIVCFDFSIWLADIDTFKVVRKFYGHTKAITDVAFSQDSRWIVSCSMDTSIRTWDIPTGRLADVFKVEQAPLSVAFSPTGDFLCTAHVDCCGLFLWANRTIYSYVSLAPCTVTSGTKMGLPSTGGEVRTSEDEGLEVFENDAVPFDDTDQLSSGLVTLSDVAKSKWKYLLNLDVIKERNKPNEAPQAPKEAPFFLPTLPGVNMEFNVEPTEEVGAIGDKSASKIMNFGSSFEQASDFFQCLLKCDKEEDFEPVLQMLKTMPSSNIDAEFRTFSPMNDWEQQKAFLNFCTYFLKKGTEFEVVQACLNLFLRLHSDVLIQDKCLATKLEEVLNYQKESWGSLEEKLNHVLCLIGFLKNSTV
eukprot:Nk52_evm49s270 gene=Nk52_evmTU49s270